MSELGKATMNQNSAKNVATIDPNGTNISKIENTAATPLINSSIRTESYHSNIGGHDESGYTSGLGLKI